MLKNIGTIRIIDPSVGQKCSNSLETPLDWSQKGAPGLVWRGVWKSGTSYAVSDAVQYQGSAYVATAPSLSIPPPEPGHWSLLAAQGLTGPAGPQGPQGSAGPAGATGPQGPKGVDGPTALIKTTSEAPGSNCASGGQRVESGLDNGAGGGTAGDGVLQTGEVLATAYVCNGMDGTNGTGSTVLTGHGEPGAGVGDPGNFYTDLDTSITYGPKTTGWPQDGINCTGFLRPGIDWRGCTLTGADLTDADLSGANLSGANLEHAKLSPVILSGANLSGASLTNAILRLATLTGADLTNASLTAAEMRGANLSGATLTGANATGIHAPQANISSASLSGATVTFADLTGAHLTSTDLSGANLTNIILFGAILTNANLTDANLTNADVDFADLTGANLLNADMTNASLYAVIWQHTTCPDGTNSDNDGGTCENNLEGL
jgi:uncharacterized protein YjbI with pentapeptide repeats